jgi:hypothetical protein
MKVPTELLNEFKHLAVDMKTTFVWETICRIFYHCIPYVRNKEYFRFIQAIVPAIDDTLLPV